MSEIDYRKEQAAAKLMEFFKAYELVTARYAEILAVYPEAATELKKAIPGLSEIEKAGNELLTNLSKAK